jgi:hypothetical protein
MEMKAKHTWGGARKGAGRKKGRKSFTNSISMPARAWELVDSMRGSLPRSVFIHRLVDEFARDLYVNIAVDRKIR